ncbi:Pinoresinol-lariciresinol reductase-like protein [Rhynchospora pubera]|uniref:Pinoresinol-lariciresinol reductase-like protein n=1 Tax=Rhynchospora pubera TaxID=906938 RepID=A0AAV8E3V9_9POAL|nr:Pinoresinol-lariciresinol reductase-like protein [Rhynchospora pubera]
MEKESNNKSRVLIVGATGFMGRKIARASLAAGHPTSLLHRPDMKPREIEKVQTLLQLKATGARLIPVSFDDHLGLVKAVSEADVVISALNGPTMASLQLKLVDAIKEAGNVKELLGFKRRNFQPSLFDKRFLPSEFGTDPSRMAHAIAPGNAVFIDKMEVRKAIEQACIPFTYISANFYMAYSVANLAQLEKLFPPRESVVLYGDGNIKSIYLDEDDVATYTIKTIDDPRTLNKTVYLRPPENILSQREVVEEWEKLIGKELHKTSISAHDFLALIPEKELPDQIGIAHFYHFFYEGCLANFEIGEGSEEASILYPEVNYTRVRDYLKRYL